MKHGELRCSRCFSFFTGHGAEVSGFKAYTGAYSGSMILNYKVTAEDSWQVYDGGARVRNGNKLARQQHETDIAQKLSEPK